MALAFCWITTRLTRVLRMKRMTVSLPLATPPVFGEFLHHAARGPGPELLHPRLLLDASHSPQSHCIGFGRNPYADGSGPNFKPSLLFTVGPHNQVAPSKLAPVIVMISGDQCQAISCERMAFRTMSETFLRALSFSASSMKWVFWHWRKRRAKRHRLKVAVKIYNILLREARKDAKKNKAKDEPDSDRFLLRCLKRLHDADMIEYVTRVPFS